ncbi:MAG: AsmA-like C-terminal region-containing protein [Bacteroidales bacterium]|jgi:hypothetical protein
MRKLFIAIALLVLFLMAFVLVVPFFIEDRIGAYVDDYFNKNLDAKIEYKPGTTLFRHFPNISFELSSLRIALDRRFNGDTIIYADRVDLLVPLFAKKVSIKEIVVKNGSFAATDQINSSEIYLYNINGSMKVYGEPGLSEMTIDLKADDFTLIRDSVAYLNGAAVSTEMDLNLNKAENRIVIGENNININGLEMFAEGSTAYIGKSVDMDIRLTTGECRLEQLFNTFSPYGFKLDVGGEGDCIVDATLSGIYDFSKGGNPQVDIEIDFLGGNIFVYEDEKIKNSLYVNGFVAFTPTKKETILEYDIDSLILDSVVATEVKGRLIVEDQRYVTDSTVLNIFGGDIFIGGSLGRTHDDNRMDAVVDMRDVDIARVMDELPIFGKFVPSSQSLEGKVDLKLRFNALLSENLSIYPYSITGEGKIASKAITIKESVAFENMKKVLQLGDRYQSRFENLDISFSVANGIVDVEPFETRVGDLEMNVSGKHGIDQSLDYIVKTEMPRAGLSGSVNSLIDMFAFGLAAFGVNVPVEEVVKMDISITGSFGKPIIVPIL